MRPWLAPPWQMWGAHRSSAGEAAIDRSFRRPEAAYLHAHYARRCRLLPASIGSEAPPPTRRGRDAAGFFHGGGREKDERPQPDPEWQTRRSFLRRVRPPISRAAERDFHLSASFSHPEGYRIARRRARHSRILSSKAHAIRKQCFATALCVLLVRVSRICCRETIQALGRARRAGSPERRARSSRGRGSVRPRGLKGARLQLAARPYPARNPPWSRTGKARR
jgi:hypothetical protein